ncbi:MAG: hypothetical protein ACRCS8_05215 [Brevinema sp.]
MEFTQNKFLSFFHTLKEKAISHPYITMFLTSFWFYSVFMFLEYNLNWVGDLYIYIEIAQNLFSGGVLYQTAIDTKNSGFFFFFYYLIYYPYALFFETTQFLFQWIAFFMTIWYFGISLLIYHILLPIYGARKSLFSVLVSLLFMNYIQHIMFLNQPQIALFFHLLLIFIVMRSYHRQSYVDYFLYGVLLAVCFSISSPYAYLVLIVPILALKDFLQTKNFPKLATRGIVAFLGFVLVLVPFFIYFYKNNALGDWWYWNLTFPTSEYSTRPSTFGAPRDLSSLDKLGLGFASIFWKSLVIGYRNIPSEISHIILYMTTFAWIVVLWQKIKNKVSFFKEEERILFIVSALCFISRLGLIRWYPSYNIYIVPIIALHFPMVMNVLSKYTPRLSSVYRYILVFGMIFSVIYMPFRFIGSYKTKLSDEIITLTDLNPNKRPTFILAQWAGYSYSTRWDHKYYNFYAYLSDVFQEKVYEHKPEVLAIPDITFKRQLNDDKEFMSFLSQNYGRLFDLTDKIPYSGDILLSSKNIFIRKDMIDTWRFSKED